MAILPIRIFGDPVLRERGRPVTDFGPSLQSLIADMTETMNAAHGAGLAAPQVGVPLRMFIYDIGDGVAVVCNPELSDFEGASYYEEGCLSLPGVYVDIERPETVTCTWQDASGASFTERVTGFMARVYQHEMDHCDGQWFIDHAERKERKEALRELRRRFAPGQLSWIPDPSEHRVHEEHAL